MGFILYFVVIAATMLLLTKFLPGFHVDGWGSALLAALVLAIVNAIVKPILFVLTLPFTIVTLGLFLLVINAAMVGLTAFLLPGFSIDGFVPALLASIALSIVGMIWKSSTKRRKNDD